MQPSSLLSIDALLGGLCGSVFIVRPILVFIAVSRDDGEGCAPARPVPTGCAGQDVGSSMLEFAICSLQLRVVF